MKRPRHPDRKMDFHLSRQICCEVMTNLILVLIYFLSMLNTDVLQHKVLPDKHLCTQCISPPAKSQQCHMLVRQGASRHAIQLVTWQNKHEH